MNVHLVAKRHRTPFGCALLGHGDDAAVLRGGGPNSVPQAGHTQPNFGRAGIGELAVAHGEELLPDAQRPGRDVRFRLWLFGPLDVIMFYWPAIAPAIVPLIKYWRAKTKISSEGSI